MIFVKESGPLLSPRLHLGSRGGPRPEAPTYATTVTRTSVSLRTTSMPTLRS
jgi:hypothetical protein